MLRDDKMISYKKLRDDKCLEMFTFSHAVIFYYFYEDFMGGEGGLTFEFEIDKSTKNQKNQKIDKNKK